MDIFWNYTFKVLLLLSENKLSSPKTNFYHMLIPKNKFCKGVVLGSYLEGGLQKFFKNLLLKGILHANGLNDKNSFKHKSQIICSKHSSSF